MEEALVEIRKLSDGDLRAKLKSLGQNVGPLTGTTRRLFEKRLARLLCPVKESDEDVTTFKQDKPSDSEGNQTKKNISPTNEGASSVCSSASDPSLKGDGKEKEGVSQNSEATVFYAVCLPPGTSPPQPGQECVFEDKIEALRLVKRIKDARFKTFGNLETAKNFAKMTTDQICPPSPAFKLPGSPQGFGEGQLDSSLAVAMEKSAFKGPKIQELVRLRIAIETSDVDAFKRLVWGNPRFLISSGDTPVVLQEGFRYNALHVSAKFNKVEMCQEILEILDDPSFYQLMYPQDTHETRAERINFLVDLYLNMPDKGLNETPLHFACKFGHSDVVGILALHPKTDTEFRNKHQETPKDVICSRCNNKSAELRQRIEELLEERYYVPLLRSEENEVQPVICEPWSPEKKINQSNSSYTPSSPRDPKLSMKACAGPMSPSKAGIFHKQWTTPPSPSPDRSRKFLEVRCGDCEKGIERIGRDLAHSLSIPWTEHWSFLKCSVDLATPEGLQKLEEFLRNRYNDLKGSIDNSHLSDITNDIQLLNCSEFSQDIDDIVLNLGSLSLGKTPNSSSSFQISTGGDAKLANPPVHGAMDTTEESSDGQNEKNNLQILTIDNLANEALKCTTQGSSGAEGNTGSLSAMEQSGAVSGRLASVCSSESSDESFYSAQSHLSTESPPPQKAARDTCGALSPSSSAEVDETGQFLQSTPTSIPQQRRVPIFIEGVYPTKLDLDVIRALTNAHIGPSTYPHVFRWHHLVTSYSDQARSSWPSPASSRLQRLRQRSAPSGSSLHRQMMRMAEGSPMSQSALANPSSPTTAKSSARPDLKNVQTNLMETYFK